MRDANLVVITVGMTRARLDAQAVLTTQNLSLSFSGRLAKLSSVPSGLPTQTEVLSTRVGVGSDQRIVLSLASPPENDRERYRVVSL